ncbi:MAG: sodium:calcium antiporter [Piscinibacter sp.]|uniref:sodium:calcium antiporter n=1 Tax=Piscinibacter sp. TaxID=1903157 RepID=UPI003D0FE2BD
MGMAWLVLQFLLCAALIAGAGYVLSRSADALADAYGWGRGWVGLAMLATVTSLPELASGVSAVALVGAPNLAVGNALGACVVNLAFLVVVDLLQRQQPMYGRASATHLLSAGFGVVMLGFVAMSLVTGRAAPQFLGVGLYSPILLGLYLLALRSVFAHEQSSRQGEQAPALERAPAAAVRREWQRFGTAALVVLAAGSWLPEVADGLSQTMGLSRSFVGTVFMALVTTLPEMAVTVSALRLGALDMALGNLLGSNLFNVLILAVDDVAYTRGPLLADAAPAHAGTAATALVMTGLVIVGLVMRPQGRVLRVASWVSVGLVAAYGINAALIYLAGA